MLPPDAFRAEVRVLRAEGFGLGEGCVGQFPQGQGRKFRLDRTLMVIHAA